MRSKIIPKSMKKQCKIHARKSDATNMTKHHKWNRKTLRKNDLFFCIKGKKTDGHNFAKIALKKGPACSSEYTLKIVGAFKAA